MSDAAWQIIQGVYALVGGLSRQARAHDLERVLDDSLFELGFDSLTLVDLTVGLEELFGDLAAVIAAARELREMELRRVLLFEPRNTTPGSHTLDAPDHQTALDRIKQRLQQSLVRVRDVGADTWTTLKERHALERVRDMGADTWTMLKEQYVVERARDVSAHVWTTLKQRPLAGTALAIAGGLALASVIDAAELAVAISAGVLAHQVLLHQSASGTPAASAAHG